MEGPSCGDSGLPAGVQPLACLSDAETGILLGNPDSERLVAAWGWSCPGGCFRCWQSGCSLQTAAALPAQTSSLRLVLLQGPLREPAVWLQEAEGELHRRLQLRLGEMQEQGPRPPGE